MIAKNQSIRALLARYSEGDNSAATEIYEHFRERLTRLARQRLSPQLAARVDAEDICQSAFRTFFRRWQADLFSANDTTSIWYLLVKIIRNKAARSANRHLAKRRDVRRDISLTSSEAAGVAVDRAPPEEAIILADELGAVMARLPRREARCLALCLKGLSTMQIAADMGCACTTVRRVLKFAGKSLQLRLEAFHGD